MTVQTYESSAPTWELQLRDQADARAAELLRDFGQKYATPAVMHANDLYTQYKADTLTRERALEESDTLSWISFRQSWGITLDHPILNEYLEQHKWTPESGADKWSTEASINEVSDLLAIGENINLETILIRAAHELAILDTYDGQSDIVYEAIVRAESVFAPLCEIIGFDGLAMALRSKAECIRMRNSGRWHYVSESERIGLMYQDENGDSLPRFHHFASSILREIAGSSDLEPVLGADSKHGIILEEGYNAEKEYREIARLKTVGSRAGKLARSIENNDGVAEVNMDDVGITIVAENDQRLVAEYIDAIRLMLDSQHITAWPSPSRDQAFHIRGAEGFIDMMRTELARYFPKNIFEFVPDDTGFHVAKMTGYYEDSVGCVPFEVQFLTQEGRRDSRVGRAAHIFYKIMRKLGKKYVPTQDEIDRLTALNARRTHMGTDGLCPPSDERLDAFIDHIATTIDCI